MPRYIDADELLKNLPDGLPYKASVKRVLIQAPTANVVPSTEVNSLELTLQGVMWSVDKWLEGDELEQDEVNRAITMREKTLRIVEQYQEKLEDYKDCWYKIHDSYNTDCLESYNKGQQKGAWDVLNELRQEINDALECNQKRLKESEWAYDIVDRIGGKIDALRGIDGFIDELEEKYFGKDTESEDTK